MEYPAGRLNREPSLMPDSSEGWLIDVLDDGRLDLSGHVTRGEQVNDTDHGDDDNSQGHDRE
jgi:hypothetical protein